MAKGDFFNSLFDSASALSRIKSREGLRISHGKGVSSFIHKSLIMKTLRRGLPPEIKISNRIETNIDKLLDRVENRLDRMPGYCLEYICKDLLPEMGPIDLATYVFKTKIDDIRSKADKYYINQTIQD